MSEDFINPLTRKEQIFLLKPNPKNLKLILNLCECNKGTPPGWLEITERTARRILKYYQDTFCDKELIISADHFANVINDTKHYSLLSLRNAVSVGKGHSGSQLEFLADLITFGSKRWAEPIEEAYYPTAGFLWNHCFDKEKEQGKINSKNISRIQTEYGNLFETNVQTIKDSFSISHAEILGRRNPAMTGKELDFILTDSGLKEIIPVKYVLK